MKKTAVIIPHYGDPALTIDCLKSLSRGKEKFHTFLIDNSSRKDLVLQVQSLLPVTILRPEENLGFAGGVNLGIKQSLKENYDLIVVLNNDTVVQNETLSVLINSAQKLPRSGLISPKIYFAEGFEFKKNRYKPADLGRVIWYAGGIIDWQNIYASHRGVDQIDKNQYQKSEETDFATGCCLLIKREVVKKIGFFDENYYLYYEDVDYSVRAKLAGFGVYFEPKARLWHKNAISSKGPGSAVHQYYQTRNRLYFAGKFASPKTRMALFRESLRFVISDAVKRRAVIDYYLGHLGKADL